MVCESQPGMYWDRGLCACTGKGVMPRGVDQVQGWDQCGGRGQRNPQEGRAMFETASYSSSWHPFVFVLLGCFITVSVILCATTCYYKRKVMNLKQPQQVPARKTEEKWSIVNNVTESKAQRTARSQNICLPRNPPNVLSQLKTCKSFR